MQISLASLSSHSAPCFLVYLSTCLPNTAFHLQLDQAVHLDGVFHRQLFDHWLDEAADDHRRRLFLAQAAALAPEALRNKVKDGHAVPEHPLFDACGMLAAALAALRDGLDRFEHVLEREYLGYAGRELEVRKRRRLR